MRTRLCWSFPAAAAGLLSVVVGCAHPCHNACCPPGPRLSAYPTFNPCQRPYVPPRPLVPFEAGPAPAPPAPMPPGPPADARGFEPPPADPGVRLAIPEPVSPQDSTRLAPPVPVQPPATPEPPLAPKADGPAPTPPLPVGIPQFAMAKNRVASGLRPMLEGIDWLQANGYKTVLNIRAPGSDDAADRKLFEQRGLRYASLELSPDTVTREVVDQFNHMVGDPANVPLFVYDRDGMLAGALWYLHFRIVDGLAHEEARDKAARLGLKPAQDGEHKRMWLAIQNYLSGVKP